MTTNAATTRPAVTPGETVLYTRGSTAVQSVAGPLLIVDGLEGVGYGDIVEVATASGTRRGQILEVSGQRGVVQVFGGTSGIGRQGTTVLTRGRPARTGVGMDYLGRVLDGAGQPRDGGPEPLATEEREVNGLPLNPIARDHPDEYIETGVSAIDGLNTLVRGQKLPIFTGYGLPANELAARIAAQAQVPSDRGEFVVVFAAMGVTSREAAFFREHLEETAAMDRTVLLLNLADDPAVERLLTPRVALTLAEHFAFDLGMHVLTVLTDITSYCEALREISAAREEMPGRRGYPGYMYTDLASIFERAGRVRGRPGSLTQLMILSMPDDDISHPVPDLTGYITEGQIVLSRALDRAGIDPPIDALPSLSRLMNAGIGAGRTREDHRGLADQLYALYARGQEVRRLLSIVGEGALSDADRRLLRLTERFEREFIGQGPLRRDLLATLDVGWQLLADFPREELTRLKPELLDRYLPSTPGRQP